MEGFERRFSVAFSYFRGAAVPPEDSVFQNFSVEPFVLEPAERYVFVCRKQLFVDAERFGIPLPANVHAMTAVGNPQEHSQPTLEIAGMFWCFAYDALFKQQFSASANNFAISHVREGFRISVPEGKERTSLLLASRFMEGNILAPGVEAALRRVAHVNESWLQDKQRLTSFRENLAGELRLWGSW